MEQTIQSQRGRVKFSHEGYIYRFDKESKTQAGVKFWRCHEDGRCRARIHTLQEAVLKKINEHTHPPSAVTVEVEKQKHMCVSELRIRTRQQVLLSTNH